MPFSRRRFLQTSSALALPALGNPAFGQAPAIITRDSARPQILSGVQAGDVTANHGIVWSRSDRAARMWVEWSTTSSFSNVQRVRGPNALEDSDFTARLDLTGLPAGQDIFYRVTFEDLAGGALSAPTPGHFRTPPTGKRDIRFVWSGDTCGQGWGINEAAGGMKCYETIRAQNPDFFIHSGDTIYSDSVVQAEVKMPDGSVWKNLTTEEKSKVAETLNEYRGNHRYNLMDANVRRFNSEIAQIWQWDDHEVLNNYSPTKDLTKDARYYEKNIALLAARGQRAFMEYSPMRQHGADESGRVYRQFSYGPLLDVFVLDMRSYRGGNSYNRQTEINAESVYLGAEQIAWLTRALIASKATWKVIAADMPIGLQVDDGKDAEGRPMFEAIANGDGPALGRELEIAQVLKFIKRNRIRNTVWLTADVHYTAAHYYTPVRAQFADFDPFWEFVSGPLHAGTFGPNPLDNTFGPELKFIKAPAAGQANLPPSADMQFFGEVAIDAKTAGMKVMLKDWNNVTLWSQELAPRHT
ncbi:MAG: alkaline phosphatase [Betaproteobacteria bacterium]|nr:alkaline phosphatase [Betaproteobacteria bacterium]